MGAQEKNNIAKSARRQTVFCHVCPSVRHINFFVFSDNNDWQLFILVGDALVCLFQLLFYLNFISFDFIELEKKVSKTKHR